MIIDLVEGELLFKDILDEVDRSFWLSDSKISEVELDYESFTNLKSYLVFSKNKNRHRLPPISVVSSPLQKPHLRLLSI